MNRLSRLPLRDQRGLYLVLALVVVGLAPYLATGFLLDDFFHLERLRSASGIGSLTFQIDTHEMGLHFWWRPEGGRFVFFRPLAMLSLVVDRAVWGDRAWGYHLTNLVLHAASVLMLAGLCRQLGLSWAAASLASLAWGLSSHVAPAVGWVSGRTELLAASWVLAAILIHLRYVDSSALAAFGLPALLVGAACLTKESGVIAPLLIFFVHRAHRSTPRQTEVTHQVWWWVLIASPVVVYLLFRLLFFPVEIPPAPYFRVPASLKDVNLLLLALPMYAVGAASSVPLLPLRTLEFLSESWPRIAVVWLAGAGIVLTLLRSGGRTQKWYLLWFLAGLAPVLLLMEASLYLYLPSVGVVLMLATAFDRRRSRLWRNWLATIAVVGLALNLVASQLLRRVHSSTSAAVSVVMGELDRLDSDRVALVDAPVWHYALPAAIRAREPSRPVEAHFLSFAPGLTPAEPSVVAWREGSLSVAPVGRPLLASAVERFLLLGPAPRTSVVEGQPPFREISLYGRPETPSRVEFHLPPDADLGSVVLIRFEGWRAVPIAAPGAQLPPSS